MKKMKYIFPLFAIPALAFTLIGAGVASASGIWSPISPEDLAKRQQTMFEHQATLLGIPVAEVKDNWAQGKSLEDIAKEKGISEADLKIKIEAQRKQMQQDHLQSLVNSGVITQAQADQRLSFEEKNPQKGRHMMGAGGRGKGMHGMRGNFQK